MIFKGEQMLKVFNRLNVKVSCLGNHDTDLGIKRMKELIAQTAPSKWLMSNLSLEGTGAPIGDLARWTAEEVKSSNGSGGKVKIGFFGLAEKEWLG